MKVLLLLFIIINMELLKPGCNHSSQILIRARVVPLKTFKSPFQIANGPSLTPPIKTSQKYAENTQWNKSNGECLREKEKQGLLLTNCRAIAKGVCVSSGVGVTLPYFPGISICTICIAALSPVL